MRVSSTVVCLGLVLSACGSAGEAIQSKSEDDTTATAAPADDPTPVRSTDPATAVSVPPQAADPAPAVEVGEPQPAPTSACSDIGDTFGKLSSVQTRTDEDGVTHVSFAVADALVEFVISGEPSKGFEVSLLIDGRPQSADQVPPNWGTDLDEAPLPVALLGGLSPLGARDTAALFWSVTPVGNPPAFTTSREPDKLVTPSIVWSGAAELSVSTVPYSLVTEEPEFAFDLDIEATNDGLCQKAKR